MQRIEENIIKEIIVQYNKGTGTNQIAKILSINRATVQRYLKRNNISLRKTSPYIKTYNIFYFDQYTKETCYWAGVLAADGCVRSDRAGVDLVFHKNDYYHLINYSNAIGLNSLPTKDKNAFRVQISGKWFKESLYEKFSITERKSLSLEFPKQIPEEFHQHFIRGYFDGDGSICKHSKNGLVYINFVGSWKMIPKINEILKINVNYNLRNKKPLAAIVNRDKYCSLHFSGKNAKSILDWLYKDTDDKIRLKRKYDKYVLWCSENP